MADRQLPWLEPTVFAVTLFGFNFDVSGGPGWGPAASHAPLAIRLDHTAASPLYDVLSSVFAYLPIGEPGFRLGLLGALLGALTCLGAVAAIRTLCPRDPLSVVASLALLTHAPAFREAVAFATPSLLGACGMVWTIAIAARRSPSGRDAIRALAAAALVEGSAPWLGVLVLIAVAVWLGRAGVARDRLWLAGAAIGAFAIALWLGAEGELPRAAPELARAVTTIGREAGAVLIGAGLVGAGFGAATRLRAAPLLLGLCVIGIAHELIVGQAAPPALAALAIGVAILPSALVRAIEGHNENPRRHMLALIGCAPIMATALLAGGLFDVDDPGSSPARMIDDVIGELPPGPGVFVATRPTTLFALAYERAIAGLRPDVSFVPPLPALQADVVVADALRAHRVVGADACAFGRLDPRRALPRGRGFQLLGDAPVETTPIEPPAQYATEVGASQAIALAIERAQLEAANAHLDRAARAAGLVERFGAADLAVLAATIPTKDHPPLFGLLPAFDDQPEHVWLADAFGDDLAWMAGIPIRPLPDDAPLARRLHAKWRAIFERRGSFTDPEITAMGKRAVEATQELADSLVQLRGKEPPRR